MQWFDELWRAVNKMGYSQAPSALPPVLHNNELEGKRLRYLIGTDTPGIGAADLVTEVSYDNTKPVPNGISIKYCNLFDEKNTGEYGPYLHDSDTADQYGEGQIDPRGPGWKKNLDEQCSRAVSQGFRYIELDNPDAYSVSDVLGAVDVAASHGLKVIAKNPLLLGGTVAPYISHTAVMGAIVERGAGSAKDMDALRQVAGKPALPVWFVAFDTGWPWIQATAKQCKPFKEMYCTFSSLGEYGNAKDITWA